MHPNFHTKTTKHGLLHSFCYYPRLRFDTQHPEEQVVLVVRAHPITQIPWIAMAVFLLFLSFPAGALFFSILLPTQALFLISFWYVLLSSYVFINVLFWLFNVGIITNERVIDVDYFNVLDKEVTEASTQDIADVTSNTIGFIPSYFDYGGVFVQTSGATQGVEYLKVPHPAEVASVISQLAVDAHVDA